MAPNCARCGGEELRVEQEEAAALQHLHQMHQRHFAGVASRENMLSPKKAAPSDTP